MLYSPLHDIGLAHYPKTAGTSLVHWFRAACPDAFFLEAHPGDPVSHLAVRPSLERLGVSLPLPLAERLLSRRVAYGAVRLAQHAGIATPCHVRIIGVLRDPFEMLVSLFEFWRSSFSARVLPPIAMIRTAVDCDFQRFIHLAVVKKHMLPYYDFFDVYGPAWANTRLLAFDDLDGGLRRVCREFDIPEPRRLERLNTGPCHGRNVEAYERLAGSLMDDVRRHFRWYYTRGMHHVVTGRT